MLVTTVCDYWAHMVMLQDSLQAFSSSIAGLLASRAVLEGKYGGFLGAKPKRAVVCGEKRNERISCLTLHFY